MYIISSRSRLLVLLSCTCSLVHSQTSHDVLPIWLHLRQHHISPPLLLPNRLSPSNTSATMLCMRRKKRNKKKNRMGRKMCNNNRLGETLDDEKRHQQRRSANGRQPNPVRRRGPNLVEQPDEQKVIALLVQSRRLLAINRFNRPSALW